jgi:hypothetical protein
MRFTLNFYPMGYLVEDDFKMRLPDRLDLFLHDNEQDAAGFSPALPGSSF